MWRNTSFQACYPLLLASLRLSALGQIVHTARHTFATSVTLANDVSIMNVSKMLGHTKLSMTQHYAKVLDQSIRKDMENVKTLLDTSQPDMELKVSKEEVLTAS